MRRTATREPPGRELACAGALGDPYDLREVSWLFCAPFLIAANALVLGLLLAYACGARSLTAHLEHVRGPSSAFFHWLVHLAHRG